MTNTDAELARRIHLGDEEAFAMLVTQYQRPIFSLALRMVGDADDAADITQTVFVKAFESIGSYNPKHAFFSWLYRIAINDSINWLKRRSRRRHAAIETPSSRPTPDEELRESERHDFIQRALAEMSVEHRVVIILKHLLLLPYREIANILDLPEKTVKSRLFAARQALRDQLLEMGYRP